MRVSELRGEKEQREENVGFRWYFTETNRRDAERFLEQPHNGKGTFLIRPSDTNQGRERRIPENSTISLNS